MKKVLVIGSGGRCHAIIRSLKKSKEVGAIYCAKGNGGISKDAICVDIDENNNEALANFVIDNNIFLTIVGPDNALENGIVDYFLSKNLRIFGPTKECAQIETSKEFAKRLMQKYNIPTAGYKSFESYSLALNYVSSKEFPVVIKYDGLALGKGVVICNSLDEAKNALKEMLIEKKFGNNKVIIEDFIEGNEFSLMCFVDGVHVYPMEPAQDHKRAYDFDQGLNTGGMGAYSPLPFITEEDKKYAINIMTRTAESLYKEGFYYKGVLYGGLIKDKNGIKVIEFNARFGDPETEIVLPRLKSDLFYVFNDIIEGRHINLEWKDNFTLGVVLASNGYPEKYEKGFEITDLKEEDAIFHMGTKLMNGKYFTNGGRVLICVGEGKNLEEAKINAYNKVKTIKCDNLFYRKDIGNKAYK